MFCEKCGTEITNGSMFCHNCGAKVAAGADTQETKTEAPAAETFRSKMDSAPQTKKAVSGYAIASLVTGIIGLFFCGIILGILAIVFANIAKKQNGGVKDGMSTAGFVLGIIALVVSAIVIIASIAFVGAAFSFLGTSMMTEMMYY